MSQLAFARAAKFESWFRAECVAGRRPDALPAYSPAEPERFWARTVPGPGGHVYWTGGKAFQCNSGGRLKPERWVWLQEHGPITGGVVIERTCDEKHCVALAHLQMQDRSEARMMYTDMQMIGKLQTIGMRLGRTPTEKEWKELVGHPSVGAYKKRFRGWGRACESAGLPTQRHRPQPVPAEVCLQALRAVTVRLGRAPGRREYDLLSPWLREHGFPGSATTVKLRLNQKTWEGALALLEEET